MRALIVVLAALATAGCGVYLHSPQNQATAETALKDFQAFREKSANPYTVMLKNVEKAKAATAEAQRAAAERRAASFALTMPHTTWVKLDGKLAAEAKELETAASTVAGQIDGLLTELGAAGAAQKDAAAKLAAAKAAVAKQFNDNQRWVAQQALFKHAIQKIAERSTATKADLTPQDALGSLKELFDVKVTVQQLKDGRVEVVEKTIGEVLEINVPGEVTEFPSLVKQLSGVSLTPATSPGIAVTILGLAADLADAEFRRAQLRVAMLQRRLEVLEALQLSIATARSLVGRARSDLAKQSDTERGQAIITTVDSFRSAPSIQMEARLRMMGAAAIPLTTLASERLRLQVELASLEHERSIRVSAINAQAHEALIGRGLEGLATYHRGGITPEEIANLIRAAQAVALGVIGARI